MNQRIYIALFLLLPALSLIGGCKNLTTNNKDLAADNDSSKSKAPPPLYADLTSEANTETADVLAEQSAANEKALKNGAAEDINEIFTLTAAGQNTPSVKGEHHVVLCNNYAGPVQLALGFKDKGGDIVTTGWGTLKQDECRTANGGTATHAFVYARSSDNKRLWKGDNANLCLHLERNFKTVLTAESANCDASEGYTMAKFSAHVLAGDTYQIKFK